MEKEKELQEQAVVVEAWAAELKQAKQKLCEATDGYFAAVAKYQQIEKEVRHDH